MIVAPYVSMGPMRRLLETLGEGIGLTLLTTFNPTHYIMGSSSVESLRLVDARAGGAVRILPRLHAKIYLCDWTRCWIGSANFTARGLGMGSEPNIELLGEVHPLRADLSRIVRRLISNSRSISIQDIDWLDALVKRGADASVSDLAAGESEAERYLAETETEELSEGFLVQELPFLEHPEDLWSDDVRAEDLVHDRFLFGIEATDSIDTGIEKCRQEFSSIHIIRSLDHYLRVPRWFGELTAWLHDRCEDRPLPYRSSLKVLLQRMLNWMVALYPGRYRTERPNHSSCYGRRDADWSVLNNR